MRCSNCGKRISHSKGKLCVKCYRERKYPERTDIYINNQKTDVWLRSK